MSNQTIYWHLPGICYYGTLNNVLFDAMNKFPNMFREGYKIGSVYGTFPSAIWNGGRVIPGGPSSDQEIMQIIRLYNSLGIPVRFTWTNVLLEEEHLKDEYCNKIMKIGNNGFNQVLVNSDILEQYIRENYPKYKVLSSTTKRILSVDKLVEELEKDYFLVVLDYDHNHNEKVIERITPYADRIEILTNEPCQPNCPNRVNHYRDISKSVLEHNTKKIFFCTEPQTPYAGTLQGSMRRPHFMSTEDINEYAKMGFVNYKIVGRGLSKDFYIDSLVYYLVKTEYRESIRKHIVGTMDMIEKMRRSR